MTSEWDIENAQWGTATDSVTDTPATPAKQNKPTNGSRSHRRTTELIEISDKFLMRRAYGEDILLQRMGLEPLQIGHSYHCITGGDVDSLSFLKVVLLHQKHLDYLLVSTWCMAAEDIAQLTEWCENGTIDHLDIYVGEIFPSSYVIEWRILNEFYESHPNAGRLKCFRNHSKIYAGFGDKFDFAIESSANINTNPRTEQGVISISTELAQFYKSYFDKIQ